jgi:hypothetical protein
MGYGSQGSGDRLRSRVLDADFRCWHFSGVANLAADVRS